MWENNITALKTNNFHQTCNTHKIHQGTKINKEVQHPLWCHKEKCHKKITHCLGCSAIVRTDFLWLVRVTLVFPATKSHSLMVESWLPVKKSKQVQLHIHQQLNSNVTEHGIIYCVRLFTCDDLRLRSLTSDCGHSVGVATQRVHVSFGSDVPHLRSGKQPNAT